MRVLQFPLTRLIVLGGILFYVMGWTEASIQAFKDSPVIGVGISIGMALVAIAIYIAWGKLIERRAVIELVEISAGVSTGSTTGFLMPTFAAKYAATAVSYAAVCANASPARR